MIYEGKSKIVTNSSEEGLVNIYFKNDVTAFNGEKHDVIKDKGLVNCYISAFFMKMFAKSNIPNHFIKMTDERTHQCTGVDIIPVEVVVRNIAAGSFCRRFGVKKGTAIAGYTSNWNKPLVEFFFKSDEHGDPPMSKDHAIMFGMATSEELDYMRYIALQVNDILVNFWLTLNIDLIDFKIEFGRTKDGYVILADEMTPDSCRLWRKGTQESMDKDVYRYGLGDLTETYGELYKMIKKS